MFLKDTFKVPVDLIQYAHSCKMHKALGIYLLLKSSCNGHITLSPKLRNHIMSALGIKTACSFNKYLKKLISHNWIGFDRNKGIYYVRGFKSLRIQHGFDRSLAVIFSISKDGINISQFIKAAIICRQVKKMLHGRKAKIIKVAGSSALKKESALQELAATDIISAYCGLSNTVIGKLLGVSKSQADRVKKHLVKLGYIRAKAKYNLVAVSENPDFEVIRHLPPNRRYSVKKRSESGKLYYQFLERTYDEIINCMEFVNQKSIIKSLRVMKKTICGSRVISTSIYSPL